MKGEINGRQTDILPAVWILSYIEKRNGGSKYNARDQKYNTGE